MPQRTLSEQEFNSIRDRVMQSLPEGLTEAEFSRQIGPRMAQAIGEAESLPARPEGSALGRFASGIAETLNPVGMAKGAYQAVTHPIETASAMLGQQADQGRQAVDLAKQGRYTEAVGHGVAAVTPLFGPMAARAGEAMAEGDVAGGMGQTTGLLAPFGASQALKMRASAQAAKAPTLAREATAQVADQVLAPGNIKYRRPAQEIAPEILRRGLQGDRHALRETAQSIKESAGQAIDDAIQAAGGDATPIKVQPVLEVLQGRIDDLSAGGQVIEGAAAKVAALRARMAQIQKLGGQSGEAAFGELRKTRDVNYGVAAEGGAYQRAGNQPLSDAAWAAEQTGSAIREAFGNSVPDLAAANADFAFAKALDQVLDPAIGRPKNMKPSSGITGGARTSGAVAGQLMGGPKVAFVLSTVIPWWLERQSNPAWQLADASAKMKLAQAIQKGDVGKAKMLMATWAKYGPKTTSPNESQRQPVGAFR